MKRRDANLILVALGALGGAVVAYSVPLPVLERGVDALGLPAIVPQAARPLGVTAHMIVIIAGALLSMLLVAILLPWRGKRNALGEQEKRTMGFLTFGRGRLALRRLEEAPAGDDYFAEGLNLDPAPVLRRSDTHPDAPPRAPLFARRDLGDVKLPPVDDGGDDAIEPSIWEEDETPAPAVRDITGLSMPRAPEPLPWEMIEREMSRVLKGVRLESEDDDEPAGTMDASPAEPSISELADRLEKGLARRRARLGDAPAELAGLADQFDPASAHGDKEARATDAERADLSPDRQEQAERIDEDLERALAALRTITKRAG